jgi:hypothetical protein
MADIAFIPRCQERVKRKMKKIIAIRKNVDEGITDYLPSMDSVSAFGRNVADTATFGGYKYARAGADYVAKKALKATGLSKKDTTYSKELDQEKEKLANDDVKHSQAAAVGDIAGNFAQVAAPGIPGVGGAIGSAINSGEKIGKISSYLGLARRAIGLKEDVPTNATGDAVQTNAVFKPMRPMARRGKFLNQETFIVSHSTFNSLREAKKKNVHWKRYLEEDDAYYDLRDYARKKREGPIIVEDENTGACMYVRYGDI